MSDIQTLIDVSKPSITSVTSTTNGLQGVGDVVDITINFSESISLTEDVVNVNLDVVFSPALSTTDIDGVTDVTFDYTVVEDDVSEDLTFEGLALGTGELRDAAGNDITLKASGTTFGSLTNSSGELLIKSGSTPTTAITFAGANATAAGNVTVSGNLTVTGSLISADVTALAVALG